MKVLVTGATGFLGLEVVGKFLAAGCEVVATGRNVREWRRRRPSDDRLSFIPADLSSEEDCTRLPSSVDCLVHCAALCSPWGSPESFVRANVKSLCNLLKRVQFNSLVHVSSSSVNFRPANRVGEVEGGPPWPSPPPNHYVATKRAAEEVLRAAVPEATILRPHAIMGPRDTSILPRVMRVARRGFFPLIGPDIRLDMVHVEDVASACLLSALNSVARGKTYNVAASSPVPRSKALTALFGSAGMKVRTFNVHPGLASRVALMMENLSYRWSGGSWEPPLTVFSVNELSHEVILDTSRIRAELGFRPSRTTLESLEEVGALWK
jgi:nucleoside-diphosphate-sugar epimerase